MTKGKSMSPITRELSKIYIINGLDILNYRLNKKNKISYHHLLKCEELIALGFSCERTPENGIVLSNYAHGYFHYIEEFAPDIFSHINKIFMLLAKERRLPTPEERNLLQIFMEAFEYRMENYRMIPNKFLVRERHIYIA